MLSSTAFVEFSRHYESLWALNSHLAPRRDSHGGIGLFTTRNIEVGQTLLEVNREDLITSAELLNDPCVGHLISSCATCAPHAFAIFLAYYRHSSAGDPKLQSYIKVLPMEHNTLLFWTNVELDALGDSKLKEEIKKKRHALQESHATLANLVEAFLENPVHASIKLSPPVSVWFSFESFMWALGILDTRAIYFQGASSSRLADDVYALMPVGDYLNHSDESKSIGRYDETRGAFVIHAKEPYAAGSEVFISYGNHPNSVLLEYYGFAITGNCYDIVFPSADLMKELSESVPEFQKEIMDSLGLNPMKNIYFSKEETLPWDTITCARLLSLTMDEKSAWECILQDTPISLQNEAKALHFLKLLLEKTLASLADIPLQQLPTSRASVIEAYRSTRMAIVRSSLDLVVRTIDSNPRA